MLISRGLPALRGLRHFNKASLGVPQQIRNSAHASWNYRVRGPQMSKNTYLVADLVHGFAWWWILWHLWTQPDHIFGEFEYPDPRKWTDEELGIPAID